MDDENIPTNKSMRTSPQLTFTNARCESVATPITVAVSGADPSKAHEVVTVGMTNGCNVNEYGHPEGTVYSTM